MERRLAAILAADVVGYSALMEVDEAGTFERLKARRTDLFEPEVARHSGRIFKLLGDGVLAEFSSVVNAVECAVALQRAFAERNASVPETQRMQIRIGINLGEVIVDGDDRYGEGVNLAARLEQLAAPGGICVSGKVAKEVEKKLAFAFEPMGERKVKNISEPVHVFRVTLDRPTRQRRRRRLQRSVLMATVTLGAAGFAAFSWQFWPLEKQQGRPALAVLPFNNYGGDEFSRLADGLTEDIINDLAQSRSFDVVARNSTDAYKGKPADVVAIAEALNVNYVLEGSIQKQGGVLRVTAMLIDAKSGNHLWSERWDNSDQNVFAVQSEIAQQVAKRLDSTIEKRTKRK
jgi:TolB-like protein/class 3 adenylate cyclase